MKDIKGDKGNTAPISLLNDKKMQNKFIALAHSEFSKRTVLAELYPSLSILDNDDIKNKAARVNYYISKHARDILLDEEVMKQHQHLGPYYTAFETRLKSTIKHIIADKARRDTERQARKEQGLSASARTSDKIRIERENKKAEKAAAKDTVMKEAKSKKGKSKAVDPIGMIESGIAGITSLFRSSAPEPAPKPQQRKRKVKEEDMEVQKLPPPPTRKSLRHGLTEAEKKQNEEELAKLTEEANKAKQAKKAELATRLQKGREERARRIAEEQQKQQTAAAIAQQKELAIKAAFHAQVEQAEQIEILKAELAKIKAENEKLEREKREREEKSNSAENTRAQKKPHVDPQALADLTRMMQKL